MKKILLTLMLVFTGCELMSTEESGGAGDSERAIAVSEEKGRIDTVQIASDTVKNPEVQKVLRDSIPGEILIASNADTTCQLQKTIQIKAHPALVTVTEQVKTDGVVTDILMDEIQTFVGCSRKVTVIFDGQCVAKAFPDMTFAERREVVEPHQYVQNLDCEKGDTDHLIWR